MIMTLLTGLGPAVTSFGLRWWRGAAGAVLGAFLAFPVGQCSGVQIQKDRQAVAAAKILKLEIRGTVEAAEQRGKDAATVAARSEGRLDAIKNQPDTRVSPMRCEYNRKRMLDAGLKPPPCG